MQNSAIVIDIGNSSTTVALADDHGIRHATQTPTVETTMEAATQLLSRMAALAIPRAAICSVVPTATAAWQTALKRETGRPPLLINHDLEMGIKLDYKNKKTIGADRLANASAAHLSYGAPIIVADFGTALTIDAVNERGCFIGGLILPGPGLFLDYLADRTACLPRLNMPRAKAFHRAIARSTRSAMRVGALLGCRGSFREALTAVLSEMPEQTAICATGGFADHVIKDVKWPWKIHIDPYLTLRGIYHILRLSYENNKRTHQQKSVCRYHGRWARRTILADEHGRPS